MESEVRVMSAEINEGDSAGATSSGYLEALSRLSTRSFASLDEAMTTIVPFVAEQVGTRSSFLSHIDPEDQELKVLAAYNAADGCAIIPGGVIPLHETF